MKIVVAILALAIIVQDKPIRIKRSEVMRNPPSADLGAAKAWIVEKGEGVQSMLVQIDGTIPMHLHPDGVHRMYVIEGKITVTMNEESKDMEPGDYVMIPKGVPHKISGKGLYGTVDMPPVDAKKIEWLEK
jgi:quercetin dioxygenase-like cupin family protein